MDLDATMRAIADILAATVLLDKKERDAEMIEFCHSIMTINQRMRPGVILPRQTILAWFNSRKEEIANGLADDADDSFKIELLSKITDPVLRRKTLAGIFAICVCDYELRDEESDFIQLALATWKAELPKHEELDMIVG